MAVPVVRAGLPRYSLVFAYSPTVLQGLLRDAAGASQLRAVLVDRQGRVVGANQHSRFRVAQPVGQRHTLIASMPDAGSYRLLASDGVPVIGAYAVSRVNRFAVHLAKPQASLGTPQTLASWAWVGLIVLTMGASVVAASLASRRLSRPLWQLGEDLRAGREPSLDPRQTLAEFDALAQALRDGTRAERLRTGATVARLVAESREAALRQADGHKDVFLATLAHELRNPLAPIRAAVEVIRLCGPSDPRVQRASAIIERQILHLVQLVDDLLDVSRISQVRLQRQPALAHHRLHGLQRGDATRLVQCLVNLLNNGIKFTPPGGRVELRVGVEDGLAVLEVSDTGAGIDEAQFDRLFELFGQACISGQDGHSGLGIGLYLVRKIVDLHGGRIEARSGGAGRGSTFRLTLPLASPAAAGPEAAQPPQEVPALE
jgi:signal transduction histidine kinase